MGDTIVQIPAPITPLSRFSERVEDLSNRVRGHRHVVREASRRILMVRHAEKHRFYLRFAVRA